MSVDKNLMNILVNERPLARMLTIIDNYPDKRGMPTRSLLRALGSNELHGLILKAQKRGFIERVSLKPDYPRRGKHSVFNRLTNNGQEVATVARESEIFRVS